MTWLRPSWDAYFLKIAQDAASRSTCPSRSVGAVIVNPETNQVISMGYNGAPRGAPHCGEACYERESGDPYDTCNAIHAETNAIISAAFNGVSTKGATMYLTTTPCIFCARMLINAGIKKIVASSYYPHEQTKELLDYVGVKMEVV